MEQLKKIKKCTQFTTPTLDTAHATWCAGRALGHHCKRQKKNDRQNKTGEERRMEGQPQRVKLLMDGQPQPQLPLRATQRAASESRSTTCQSARYQQKTALQI